MDWQRGIPQTLQVSTHELTKPNPAQEKKARDLQQPAGVVQTSSASSSDPMTASCRTCGLRRSVRTRRGANQLRGGGARVALRARTKWRVRQWCKGQTQRRARSPGIGLGVELAAAGGATPRVAGFTHQILNARTDEICRLGTPTMKQSSSVSAGNKTQLAANYSTT